MIIQILIIANILYLAFALIYHKKDKSLTLHVFSEYLLTATLALILIAGVLF